MFYNGMQVVESKNYTKGVSKEPLKKNKNRRIQKKWIKKYGFKSIPDPSIYVCDNMIFGHPQTIRKMIKTMIYY